MTGILLALGLLASEAQAGAPPVEVIPWDSVWVDIGAPGDTTNLLLGYWTHFVTRDAYRSEVLGEEAQVDMKEIGRNLEIIKSYLKAKKKK